MRIANLHLSVEHHIEFVARHDGCSIRHVIRADVPDDKFADEARRLQRELLERVYEEHAEPEAPDEL